MKPIRRILIAVKNPDSRRQPGVSPLTGVRALSRVWRCTVNQSP